jgi:hypothetical protein
MNRELLFHAEQKAWVWDADSYFIYYRRMGLSLRQNKYSADINEGVVVEADRKRSTKSRKK